MLNNDTEKINSYLLGKESAPAYVPLVFRSYREYLLHCGQDNIAAIGAENAEGEPIGLALALTVFDNDGKLGTNWTLLSLFVREDQRRKGVGRKLWERMKEELTLSDCRCLRLQGVFRENTAEGLGNFLEAVGFARTERIAKIFGFSQESIRQSVFVKGAMAENFNPDERFSFRTFAELTEANLAEITENAGEWYPAFVNPLIGKEKYNDKCTLFAVDPKTEQIAGWITVLNVNNDTRLLYRTFFTRESYRNTPVGFHLFTEAIKNNLIYYPERCGLSSIPMDNEKAMRFSELFFRNAVDYISYEIRSEYCFPEKEES